MFVMVAMCGLPGLEGHGFSPAISINPKTGSKFDSIRNCNQEDNPGSNADFSSDLVNVIAVLALPTRRLFDLSSIQKAEAFPNSYPAVSGHFGILHVQRQPTTGRDKEGIVIGGKVPAFQ